MEKPSSRRYRAQMTITQQPVSGPMEKDRYGGMSPWALAYPLKSKDCPCPVCGGHSVLDAKVDCGGSPALILTVGCGKCGDISLDAEVLKDGDVRLTVSSSGEEYEPSFEAAEARKDIENSEGEARISAEFRLGEALRTTMREHQSLELGMKIIGEAKELAQGSEAMRAIALDETAIVAGYWSDRMDFSHALSVYNDVKSLADGWNGGSAYMFRINRSLAQFMSMDMDGALRSAEKTAAKLDRLASKNALPKDDRLIRAKAYEALGHILTLSGNIQKGAKTTKSAVEEAAKILTESGDGEELLWFVQLSLGYGIAAARDGAPEKGVKALADAVRIAEKYRDQYPDAYVDAALKQAMLASAFGTAPKENILKDLNEAVSFLEKPAEDGSFNPKLVLAYLYRGAVKSGDPDNPDAEDLEKAYSLLWSMMKDCSVPFDTFSHVSASYLVYLEGTDKGKAEEVRSELRKMGLFESVDQTYGLKN